MGRKAALNQQRQHETAMPQQERRISAKHAARVTAVLDAVERVCGGAAHELGLVMRRGAMRDGEPLLIFATPDESVHFEVEYAVGGATVVHSEVVVRLYALQTRFEARVYAEANSDTVGFVATVAAMSRAQRATEWAAARKKFLSAGTKPIRMSFEDAAARVGEADVERVILEGVAFASKESAEHGNYVCVGLGEWVFVPHADGGRR